MVVRRLREWFENYQEAYSIALNAMKFEGRYYEVVGHQRYYLMRNQNVTQSKESAIEIFSPFDLDSLKLDWFDKNDTQNDT